MAPSYREDDEQERQFDFDWDHEALPDYLKPFLTDDTPGAQASSPPPDTLGSAAPAPTAGAAATEHSTGPAAGQSAVAGPGPTTSPSSPPAGSAPPAGPPPPSMQTFSPAAAPTPPPSAPPAGDDLDFPDVEPFDFGAMTGGNEFDFESNNLPTWLSSAPAASGTDAASGRPAEAAGLPDWLRTPPANPPAPAASTEFDFNSGALPSWLAAGPPATPAPANDLDFAGTPDDPAAVGALSEANSDVDDFIDFLSVSTVADTPAPVLPPAVPAPAPAPPPAAAPAAPAVPAVPAMPRHDPDFDLPPGLEPFSFEGLDLGMPAQIPREPGPSDIGGLAGDEFNFEPFMFDQGAADVAFAVPPAPARGSGPFAEPPAFSVDAASSGAAGSSMPPGLEDLPDLQPFSFEGLEMSNSADRGFGTRESEGGYSRRAGDYDTGRTPLPFSFDEESAASAEDVHNFSWQRPGAAARPAPHVPEVPDSSTSIFAKARKRKEELEQALRHEGDTQDAVVAAPPAPPPPAPSTPAPPPPEEAADLVYWPNLDQDALPAASTGWTAQADAPALESAPPTPALPETASAPAEAELLWSIPVAESTGASPAATDKTGTGEEAAPGEFDFSGLQPFDLGSLDLTPEERAYLTGPPAEATYSIPELQTLDQDTPVALRTQDIEPFSFDPAAFAVPAEPEPAIPAAPAVSPVAAESWSEMTGEGIFDFSDMAPAPPAAETPPTVPEPAPPETAPAAVASTAAAPAAPPVAPRRTPTAPLTELEEAPAPPMPEALAASPVPAMPEAAASPVPAMAEAAAPAPAAVPAAPAAPPVEASAPVEAPPAVPLAEAPPAAAPAAPSQVPAAPAAAAGGSIDELIHYLDVSPNDAAARLALAIGYEHREDYPRAAEQYKKLIKARDVPANMIEIVVENLRELVDTQPDNAGLHRLLGDAYMKQGQFQMAINQYNWLLTKGSR